MVPLGQERPADGLSRTYELHEWALVCFGSELVLKFEWTRLHNFPLFLTGTLGWHGISHSLAFDRFADTAGEEAALTGGGRGSRF